MTIVLLSVVYSPIVSTHMPLARHDFIGDESRVTANVSTHMPLARHDWLLLVNPIVTFGFYSHASCEA